ncbi:MAG: hypothetical protein HC875_24475 [Anaerolineales bacterium]|nr:hypothetical protein [Anaerolineales bacterium]
MKKIAHGFTVVVLLALLLTIAPLNVLAQEEEVVCESDAIVQGEDSLSTLADKYYGNILAYPVIVEATNAKAATDSSYTKIDDPNVIEAGSKLCIPPGEVAQKMLNESVFTQVSADQTAQTLVIGITEDTVSLDPGRAMKFMPARSTGLFTKPWLRSRRIMSKRSSPALLRVGLSPRTA